MENSGQCPSLLEEFRCLWDSRDFGFYDKNQREQGYKQLLEKHNSRIGPVDMVTLKLLIACVHRRKTGYYTKSVCAECFTESEDIAKLLPEFRCLWDYLDLNFSDKVVKAECLDKLLIKYNENKKNKINMEQLLSKLNIYKENLIFCSRLDMCRTKLHLYQKQEGTETPSQKVSLLIRQYPCLWDPEDSEYNSSWMRATARKHLLEKYNAVSIVPIDMQEIKKLVNVIRLKLERTTLSVSDIYKRFRHESPSTAAAGNSRYARHLNAEERIESRQRIAELIRQFPCLWDTRHVDYKERAARDRARCELMKKCNAVLSTRMKETELSSELSKFRKSIKKDGPWRWNRGSNDAKTSPVTDLARERLLQKRKTVPNDPTDNMQLTEEDKRSRSLKMGTEPANAAEMAAHSNSDDSQLSQPSSYSTETFLEDSEEPADENFENSVHDLDNDSDIENDYKDIKCDPMSVTDTEIVKHKQAINVSIRETNEGKRRVYVDFDSFASRDYDRNDDTCTLDSTVTDDYVAHKKAKMDSRIDIDCNSRSISSCNDKNNDNVTECNLESPPIAEVDLTTDDGDYIIHENVKIDSVVDTSEVERTISDKIVETNDSKNASESSEMWYSVEIPNIFR